MLDLSVLVGYNLLNSVVTSPISVSRIREQLHVHILLEGGRRKEYSDEKERIPPIVSVGDCRGVCLGAFGGLGPGDIATGRGDGLSGRGDSVSEYGHDLSGRTDTLSAREHGLSDR